MKQHYPLSFAKSAAHQKKAHELIPGGAHTYAKGDDEYPQDLCPVIVRGAGAHVWDLDGNELIEYGAGVRSITLGHGYEPVCRAARDAMYNGTNFVRPGSIELAAAEKLLSIMPHTEMVKFGKNASDAVSGAVKLARSYTNRDMVMVCADHPFFSVDDWFIGITEMNSGIPEQTRKLTVGFRYNDLASAQAMFDAYPGRIACIVLEPERNTPPLPVFLKDLQELAHRNGALFILDETITGFRWEQNSGQNLYNITPDLSIFGKGMSNGFAVSALCGQREYMELAGIRQTQRERCFVLSLTHGAETHALAAHIATIEAYQSIDPIGTMIRQGTKLRDGLRQAITRHGMSDYLPISGRPQLLLFGTLDQQRKPSQPFRTLFMQELLRQGIVAPNFVINAAHSDEDIQRTIEVVDKAAEIYARALSEGIEKYLVGRPVKPVFRKMN